MGVFITKGLFCDHGLERPDFVQYTLRDEDYTHPSNGITYPSLYKLYLQSNDPTEYIFANTHLYSWAHWEMIVDATWFQEFIVRWRKELELKMRAEALNAIRDVAEDKGNRSHYEANKYLLTGNWIPKEVKTKGRPTKAQITEQAKIISLEERRLEQDALRITG